MAGTNKVELYTQPAYVERLREPVDLCGGDGSVLLALMQEVVSERARIMGKRSQTNTTKWNGEIRVYPSGDVVMPYASE